MDPASIAEAADRLMRQRRAGMPLTALPDRCRPRDEAEAYAIQRAVHRLRDGDEAVAGYKIGCTTPVMRAFLGIGQPCAGGIRTGQIHRRSARLAHGNFRRVGVECEIAVQLARDLPEGKGPADRQAVTEAVGACAAAIEIVDDRYEDYRALGAPTLIADDFFGAGAVLADPVTDWQTLDLAAAEGALLINGTTVAKGAGAMAMGHPFEPVAWLANLLAASGERLRAGQIVLTGSLVETRWLAKGDHVAATVAGLGTAELDVR
ncbi:MAG: 2-keto-4-pentenoate hydratase [Inquilinaceae bacterium]